MAEARSAVSELHIDDLEEGKVSWKDFLRAWTKYLVRSYYRTRNSIRNGVWPASVSNLTFVFAIIFGVMLTEPTWMKSFNYALWNVGNILHLPKGLAHGIRGAIIAWVVALGFFIIVAVLQQYSLRILLSYRGWMYEPLRVQSKRTLLWAVIVRIICCYQPSLYSCQRALPKLPVPPLSQTLAKLLDSLKPLCTSEEFADIEKKAKKFENGLGPKLQKILILRSWWATNYVSDWWEKYVYLMNRSPLAINSNYYGMDQSYWSPTQSPASRAATFVHHGLMFKRLIDREELAPLVIRKTIPICMAQYERAFSTTRIPGEEIDTLLHYDSDVSRFVLVIRKGVYYVMDVYDVKGQLLSPSTLEEQFQWIIEDADEHAAKLSEEERSVAALTALDRVKWAKIRNTYMTSGVNKKTMTAIEQSIIAIVLADYSPHSLVEKGKFLLHGDGHSIWFDKCMNLIFFDNGQAGMNCEHSMADAPVMAHICEYIMTKEVVEKLYTEDGCCMPMPKSFRQRRYSTPKRLTWDINEDLACEINKALSFARMNNTDLDLEVGDHDAWGKGIIKKCKISPDAFIQMALQLAYYKEAGKLAQTYEASMTRLYLGGRTETVRSCTMQTAQFVKSMVSNTETKETKIQLLREASEIHQNLYRDAMNGKGIDRHLFALFVTCKGLGYEGDFLKEILSRPWTLSTSQQPHQQQADVPDANLRPFHDKVSPGGGFGPVSDSGYGVSYMLSSDYKIFFHVSSKKSAKETNSKRFLANIFQSLAEMKELFD